MERYIGMDVHAASCTLAVISEKGRKLKDFPVETNGQALVEAVRMIPGHKPLVFEEGLQSAWIYETLRPHVDELVVAGITESRGHKSDKRDAYGLAEKLRVGDLDKQVFKAPRQFTRLRELSRIHMTLVGDVVRAQSRIKSLYRSRGVLVSGVNVYGVRHREEWQKQLCSSAQTRAARLYDPLDFLLEQKKQAEGDLLREAKKHPIVGVLETAPGFGPIRAARLVPVVITPHRFRTKRQFRSYCGLGIVTRSTSDWIQSADGGWIKARVAQTRGLSRQHNRVLKDIFKGAATTVITQCNKDPIHAEPPDRAARNGSAAARVEPREQSLNSRPSSWNGSRRPDRRICGDGGSTSRAPTLWKGQNRPMSGAASAQRAAVAARPRRLTALTVGGQPPGFPSDMVTAEPHGTIGAASMALLTRFRIGDATPE